MGPELYRPTWVLEDDGWHLVDGPPPDTEVRSRAPSILDRAGPHEPREREIDPTPSLQGQDLIDALASFKP